MKKSKKKPKKKLTDKQAADELKKKTIWILLMKNLI